MLTQYVEMPNVAHILIPDAWWYVYLKSMTSRVVSKKEEKFKKMYKKYRKIQENTGKYREIQENRAVNEA